MRPSQGTLPSMRDNPVAPVPTCVDPRIRITLKIVNERKATLQLSLAETSTMLGLSEAHLLRLFHREVGKTFRRYLRDVRMTQAAELVKQNARSIKQIAIECGYSDLSNFYRDFRSVHAVTPREARLGELTTLANVSQVPTATIAIPDSPDPSSHQCENSRFFHNESSLDNK
jgi:AraC-like DNA-binding protein